MTANPTLLSMPLAQNGQKNVIPATQATAGDGLFSQSTGFPAETSLPLGAGGVAPSREDFNGMANLLGGVAFYAQKGWQFQFDAGQEYFAGCIVRDTTDGKLYECINDVAAGGSVPSSDTENWKEFGVDTSTFANTDLSNLTATGEARFAHVVIDSYYDSTTGDWWREYADGWIEQGGSIIYDANHNGNVVYNLLKPYASANYFLIVGKFSSLDSNWYPYTSGIGEYRNQSSYTHESATSFKVFVNANIGSAWFAAGMGVNS